MLIGETMADENIKIGIQVSSNTDQETKKAVGLKAAYEGAAKAAASIGGTAGSRAAANAAGTGEGTAYGVARSTVGTGAAGRDFAQQAQGLGGLVHVYATFAANLFAVGAAFTALSKAADTTNMVSGLDQLGAASGRSLGTLAKQMVAATDGAISLKDAMGSTALASAGGMTNSAILRMTDVAKKASIALGRDMSDSMDRLTKGIVKIQPELLDELGIMTRVIPAQEAYARTIGKSASSLTDFEKRQAFANAVLEEGEKKFSSIALTSNPYSQLLAGIQNVAQAGLELVNKALTPIISALAQSPTALTTALIGIASILLKQAIPAIGMFRENAKRMAEEAHDRVSKQVTDQIDASSKLDAIAAMSAEKKFQAEKTTQDKISKLQSARFSKEILGPELRGTLKKSTFDLTSDDMAALKTKADTLLASDNELYQKQGLKLATHLDKINELKNKSTAAGDEAAAHSEKRDSAWYSHQEQLARNLDKLTKDAAKRTLLSGVADTSAVLGPAAAFKQLREEVNKLDASPFGKGMTTVKGTLNIATEAVGTFINAFGTWAQVATLVVTGIGLVDSALSKANKELDSFNDSINRNKDASDNLDRTLTTLAKNKGMSTEGIAAVATAYNELAESLKSSVQKATEFSIKAEGFDKFKQGFKSIFNMDVTSELSKDIASKISHAFELASNSKEKIQLQEDIKNIVGIDISASGIIKGIGIDEFKAKQLLTVFEKYTTELSNSASRMTELKASLDQTVKLSLDLSNSFIPSDNLGKMGMAMNDVAKKMQASMDKPLEQFRELNDIIKDTSKLALFGLEIGKQLLTDIENIKTLASQLENTESNLATYKVDLADAEKTLKESFRAGTIEDALVKIPKLKEAIKHLEEVSSQQQKDAGNYGDIFQKAQIEAAKEGSKLLSASLNMAFEKAGLTIERAMTTGFSGRGAAAAELSISNKEIGLQQSQIDAQIANTIALKELTIQFEVQGLQDRLDREKDVTKAAEISKQLGVARAAQSMVNSGATYKTVSQIINNPDATDESKKAALSLSAYTANIAGSQAQKAQNAAQTVANTEKARVGKINEDIAAYTATTYTTEKNKLATKQAELQVLSQLLNGYTTEYDIKLSDNKLDQMAVDSRKAEFIYQKDLEILKGKTSNTSKAQADLKSAEDARKVEYTKLTVLEKQVQTRLKIQDSYLKEKNARDILFTQEQQSLQFKEQDITMAKDLVMQKNALWKITDEQAEAEKRSLDRQGLENSYALDSLRLAKEKADKLADIQLKIDQANATPGADPKLLEDAKTASVAYYTAQGEQLDRVNGKKRASMDLDQSMSDKMKGFSKIVEDSFNNMADALVTFAQTGKLSFKGLINGMIVDLVRFELRAQMSAVLKGTRGLSGILNVLGNTFNPSAESLAVANGTMPVMAKGGAFDGGVSKFAMGGAFTNSIVNSPTLFKFAQGTGMMGEAGPEAIMPLKRDSNGNLGVRTGGQGTTSVVVNNYGSEQATTKESTDSKGNRRIEVIIGEAVAKEVGRANSPVNSSLKSNFQLQPNLVRR